MKNIIVPIDFSDTSDLLLQGAIDFAKDINGKIHLLHVAPTDLGFAMGDMGFQYFPEIESSELSQELTALHLMEKKVMAFGVPCEHLLKKGFAAEIVLQYAQEKGAHYIVMGSHGRSGIYDVFVGSLTKEITQKSTIPVLVFPCHL